MRRVLWSVLLTACGGFGSAYDAQETLAELTCERAFACRDAFPADVEHDFASLYGPDAEACPARLGPDPSTQDAWDAAEEAGRILYEPGAARACVDALEVAGCDAFWQEPGGQACDVAITGTVEAEGACTVDAECISGACAGGECL